MRGYKKYLRGQNLKGHKKGSNVCFSRKGVRGEQGMGGGVKKHGETIVDHVSYVGAKFVSWQLLLKGATGP